jgi:damage-control phosphatase, subfamily I
MWKVIGTDMNTELDCLPCFTRQALDALNLVTSDDELRWRVMREALRAAAQFSSSQQPPEMAQIIHSIIREATGNNDPYHHLKKSSTDTALRMESVVRPVIENAINPFHMAVRFAIAGNIMDYALTSKWKAIDVDDFIEETRLQPLCEPHLRRFEQAVNRAKSILYLADNAGETVFDRLLLEQFPPGITTVAVKSGPIINDATREDAIEAGLGNVAELIENGSNAPGTILDQCSDAFLEAYHTADLVIAKGQANWETLHRDARELWFLTRVKCPIVADRIERPLNSWQIIHHPGVQP